MSRNSVNGYYIVRIDHQVMPCAVAYVGHGDTPYDLNLRFTYVRESATRYGSKRDAIREAKRLHRTFNGYQFKVNHAHQPFGGTSTVFDTLQRS